jgi:hypothetical protein
MTSKFFSHLKMSSQVLTHRYLLSQLRTLSQDKSHQGQLATSQDVSLTWLRTTSLGVHTSSIKEKGGRAIMLLLL